jgi:cysteine desulfurase/selenocysteine lyase
MTTPDVHRYSDDLAALASQGLSGGADWGGTDGVAEAAALLPDAAALSRLANELFAALPGERPCLDAFAALTAGQGPSAARPSVPAPAASSLGQGVVGFNSNLPAAFGASPSAALPGLPAGVPHSLGSSLASDLPLARTASLQAIPLPYEEELGQLFREAVQLAAPLHVPSSFYFVDNLSSAPGGSQFGSQLPGVSGGFGSFARPFDVHAVRRDFPILGERVKGKPLVWLDNAATTQKPQSVIDRLSYFYAHENSNIHRAAHELAARATDAYEGAREKVRGFVNARSANEIVFVRGTTEAINLVAQSWGRANIGEGDEIVITWLEHHANIVPWQQLCAEKGAKLRVAPVDDDGQVILEAYEKLLGPRTKLVSFTQVSNALGTVTPAAEMVRLAHQHGARVLVDGAQSVSHLRADVQLLDCDWFVFSGHKVFGPTGIGALYGKEELLNASDPWQGGGNMIKDVTFEKTEYHAAPGRFEAGTGNIADAVGLGAAIDYVQGIGIDNIARHEHELLVYGSRLLCEIPGLCLIGTAADKAGVLSFVLDGYSTAEVGDALSKEGIAVRSGHHCAQPILRRFGLESTVRPSLALYNTTADLDALVAVVRRLRSARSRLK